jgi:hypothetical protein
MLRNTSQPVAFNCSDPVTTIVWPSLQGGTVPLFKSSADIRSFLFPPSNFSRKPNTVIHHFQFDIGVQTLAVGLVIAFYFEIMAAGFLSIILGFAA